MPKTSGSLTYGFTEADVGLQAFLRDGRNDPAEMRRRLEERFHRAFDRRALEYARSKVGGATSMRVRNGRRPGASTLMADGSATRPDCAPSNHHAEPDWPKEGACECTVSHFACSYGMPQGAVSFGTSRGQRSCGVSPHGAYRDGGGGYCPAYFPQLPAGCRPEHDVLVLQDSQSFLSDSVASASDSGGESSCVAGDLSPLPDDAEDLAAVSVGHQGAASDAVEAPRTPSMSPGASGKVLRMSPTCHRLPSMRAASPPPTHTFLPATLRRSRPLCNSLLTWADA
jgi:hypothetical protein